jgi:PAS domain S-box-containing protein
MTEHSQGTILYVDDDEVNRYAFTSFFQQAGFAVRAAASGDEALRLVAERPDLVILDVNLPDINGVEVCRRIKAHPATTTIPVLHLSGVYVQPEDRAHALQDSSDGYLTKPVEPAELLAQAKALLRIHQAEGRARTAAHQWQATFDALGDGVCLLDQQGRVLRCNRALAELLQTPAHELLGRPYHELTPGTLAQAVESVFQRMRKSGRRESAELPLAGRWLQAVADPVVDENGTLSGAVYILSDITERKRGDEQLQHSETMQSVGRLALEVSHDLNNLLTIITGNLSLVLAGVAEQDPSRASLLAIDLAAWRVAELTRQLLGFARRTAPRLQRTDLRTCLAEVVGMLRWTVDPSIHVEVRSAPDLWTVQADPGLIKQVLLSLCLNAWDALPKGDGLLWQADNVVLDRGHAQLHPDAQPGEFVRLCLQETSQRIPAEAVSRVFEPSFPTGELGLAVIHGIMQQHRGWIEGAGAVCQGGWLDLYLPRAGDDAPGSAPPPQGPPPREGSALALAAEAAAKQTLGSTALGPAPVPPDTAAGGQSRSVAPAVLPPDQAGPAGTPEQAAPAVLCRSRLTKVEAEELLDWLEANGYPNPELDYEEGKGFVVRWQARSAEARREHERESFLQMLKRVWGEPPSPSGGR